MGFFDDGGPVRAGLGHVHVNDFSKNSKITRQGALAGYFIDFARNIRLCGKRHNVTTRIVNNDTCHVPKNRVLLYISVVLKSDYTYIHYMWLEVPILDKI